RPRSRGTGRFLIRAYDGGRSSELMGVSVPGEVTTEGQPAPPIRSFVDSLRAAFAPLGGLLRPLEVDTRMLGLVGALAVIWIAFDVLSGGTFLSPRNLWNL